MASAKKLRSGSYRVQACKTIDGKKVIKSFTVSPKEFQGDPKDTAKKAKAQAELLARNWLFQTEQEEKQNQIITVEQACEAYIKAKKDVWSPSTHKDYLNMHKHLTDINSMDINDVDTKVLQALINSYAIQELSSKTIKNRINFVRGALEFCGVDKRFKLAYPKTVPPTLLPPEPSEFHRLLEMASPEEKLMIILSGLYTLRRGEIGGLCGEDMLWDMNTIYIHTSRVKNSEGKWVRKRMPKNYSSVRSIRLDPEIMKLFPHVAPKEYIIKMNPDEMTHHFGKLRKKACVNCRLHDLRKYAASIRSEMMPSKYVEADGGWSKESRVMQTIYDKPFKEKRNEYSKKFNERIVTEYGKELFGS